LIKVEIIGLPYEGSEPFQSGSVGSNGTWGLTGNASHEIG